MLSIRNPLKDIYRVKDKRRKNIYNAKHYWNEKHHIDKGSVFQEQKNPLMCKNKIIDQEYPCTYGNPQKVSTDQL